jgi:hypothetical protein
MTQSMFQIDLVLHNIYHIFLICKLINKYCINTEPLKIPDPQIVYCHSQYGLLVQNLPECADSNLVYTLFRSFGNIKDIKIMMYNNCFEVCLTENDCFNVSRLLLLLYVIFTLYTTK